MRSFYVLFFVLASLTASCTNPDPTNTMEKKHLTAKKNVKIGIDSTKIDTAQFHLDREYYQGEGAFPIHPGFFPTYMYDSPGNGTIYFETTIAGLKCVGRTSFFYRGEFNEHLFKGEEDESMMIFTIIVPTTINAPNDCFVTSRNHPNYIAQGTIQTETQPIDWLSIQPFNGVPSAIVNTKYFDLSHGRIVLVYPQEDKSLRFQQVPTPFISAEAIEEYVKDKSTSKEWEAFYTKNHDL